MHDQLLSLVAAKQFAKGLAEVGHLGQLEGRRILVNIARVYVGQLLINALSDEAVLAAEHL